MSLSKHIGENGKVAKWESGKAGSPSFPHLTFSPSHFLQSRGAVGCGVRVLLAGGGTGGHVFPALALADALRRHAPETEILFVGTERGMERHAVPQAGYPIRMISVIGLRRQVSWEWFRFPFALNHSLRETRRLFRAFRPHLVIGTGGYVSGPVGVMAGWFGVPLVIQEQNSYPGITTRLLAWLADQVHLTFPESERFFLRKRNLQVSGNPTRSEIGSVGRTEARKRLGFAQDKPTLCVIGGSQGAHSINVALSEALDRLTASGIQVLWQTGERDYEWASQTAARCEGAVRAQGFVDMPTALGAADLVLCRAGAMTLAEITRCGLPAILVPYPYATANHQEHNARSLVEAGAAELILDRELSGDLLTEKVSALLKNTERLARMRRTSRSLGRPMAAQEIADCGLRILE